MRYLAVSILVFSAYIGKSYYIFVSFLFYFPLLFYYCCKSIHGNLKHTLTCHKIVQIFYCYKIPFDILDIKTILKIKTTLIKVHKWVLKFNMAISLSNRLSFIIKSNIPGLRVGWWNIFQTSHQGDTAWLYDNTCEQNTMTGARFTVKTKLMRQIYRTPRKDWTFT